MILLQSEYVRDGGECGAGAEEENMEKPRNETAGMEDVFGGRRSGNWVCGSERVRW